MIIVFDTNIWRGELYLREPVGAATRFFIAHNGAQVALPEVVRLEVEHHLRQDIRNCVEKIKNAHKRLLAIFGKLKVVALPSENEIEKRISEVFSLGVELIDVPFTFESAKDSFRRTIEKTPPSDKDQQFKDGVLWANCLALSQRDEVFLVTGDKAFYEGREYSKGLSTVLRSELEAVGGRLTLLSQLKDIFGEIRSEITIDEDRLVTAFSEFTRESVENLMQGIGFEIAEQISVSTDLFVTEDPQELYLQFVVSFRCTDVSGENRGDAVLELKGGGSYNSVSEKFTSFWQRGEELRFPDTDGNELVRRNSYASALMSSGHADVTHRFLHKI